MCVLTYSDPPRTKEIIRVVLCSLITRKGRRNARVARSSNRPRRKKESDDRITDPLFEQKLSKSFFGEKVRHPMLPFYPHICMRKNSLSFSLFLSS